MCSSDLLQELSTLDEILSLWAGPPGVDLGVVLGLVPIRCVLCLLAVVEPAAVSPEAVVQTAAAVVEAGRTVVEAGRTAVVEAGRTAVAAADQIVAVAVGQIVAVDAAH